MADLDAKAIVDALGLTPAESLYLRLVARAESYYGTAWDRPTQFVIDKSASFGLTGHEGSGSNNWGAVQGTGDAGSFQHVDRDASGTWYVAPYRKYSSPEAGASDLVRRLLKDNVRKALAAGDFWGAVSAQIDQNHYTGSPPATPTKAYGDQLLRLLPEVLSSTGESNPFPLGRDPATGPALPSPSRPYSASLLTTRSVEGLSVLDFGTFGPDVAFVQFQLGKAYAGRVDGIFGPVTRRAVVRFQQDNNLGADGIVGPETWKALRNG